MKIISSRLLFNVEGNKDWQISHAMLPTAQEINEFEYRIFFGARNKKNQSHIGSFKLDLRDFSIEREEELLLGLGELGCFDDNGVLPSCCINHRDRTFLYYIGFKPGGTTRMDLYGGLAIFNPDLRRFERWSKAPILERNRVNPYINTAPFVIEWKGILMMYYVGGLEWVNKDLPRYNIQIATSEDGLNWCRNGKVAIDLETHEDALARPFVYTEGSKLKMLFSSKGENYKIAAATSECGYIWKREKVEHLAEKLPGFDDEMQCYPILIGPQKNIILYNGNGYGKSGIMIGEVAE